MLTKQEAAEWADALESGRWEQCFYDLGDETTEACAAGVYMFEVTAPMPCRAYGFATVLNDYFHYDFHQIADIIRQRYQVEVA